MTDSVFKNMKEKAYFLKSTCWEPSDFYEVLEPQISVSRIHLVRQKKYWFHRQQTRLEV